MQVSPQQEPLGQLAVVQPVVLPPVPGVPLAPVPLLPVPPLPVLALPPVPPLELLVPPLPVALVPPLPNGFIVLPAMPSSGPEFGLLLLQPAPNTEPTPNTNAQAIVVKECFDIARSHAKPAKQPNPLFPSPPGWRYITEQPSCFA